MGTQSAATSHRNMIIAVAFGLLMLGAVVYVMSDPSAIDKVAGVVSGKTTINAGRFCRKDDARNCWDVDMPGPTVFLVWPNGKRSEKGWTSRAGKGEVDFEIDALDDGQTQFKIGGPNTLMVKHSGNNEWTEFVRK